MAGKIKVPSELVPSQSNKIMLRSKYIYDDIKGHTQEEVNAALEEQIESKVIEAGGVNWDAVPTAGSNNAVKSKDIKAALEKVTGYFVLDSNITESTVAKTVTVADFPALTIGGSIKIKMLTKNTATNPTLRIGPSNALAYPLYYNNEKASADNSWEENEVISVYFDGINYQASNAQGGGGKAEKIKYDNSQSGLVANNVQEALDEVADSSFDISKYKAIDEVYAKFRTFAEALGTSGANIPSSKRKGGMTIKYIHLTDGTYSIVKTEELETQPSGTEIEEAIAIADGTYTASQLEGIETLPANIGDVVTYYLVVAEEIEVEPETEGDEPTTETVTTYTKWDIKKLTNDITEYVQWMLKNTQWSIDEKDWVGIDTELDEDKTGTPATKAVSEYAQLREDVVAAALCDLHENLTVLPDDIMRYNSRKKKILVFGASIEANARSGSGWDVNDPRGWLYWLNKAPYVDTIYNFANGSSCLTSRMTSTYSPSYRTKDNTINIYWNQIIHALQRYLAGDIEVPDVVLISQGGNDIQWNANSRGSIFNDTADEVFSTNMNDFNFTGYTDEQVINGDFPDDGDDIAEMRVNMLSIAKAVRYISEIVYTYWPETQIIWASEMYTRGGDIPRANVENRFNEFGDKIESCCIKMGIPFLRCDKECGRWMTYEMKKHIEAGGSADDDYNQGKAHAWGFTQDGYHPTVKGAELFGRYMINKLASVLRY